MKVISANTNGIRAAERKGFFGWLQKQKADVVCIQETKAAIAQLKARDFFPVGHHVYYNDAQKAGYSGVAVYSRVRPDQVRYGLGHPVFDSEGRWVELSFGDLTIASLYLPSGSSGEVRQQFKFEIMDWLMPKLEAMASDGRHYLICGDWNIAHREIDLKNATGNRKNSGFLPEERAWMERLFGEAGWVDAFRRVEPGEGHYTFWSSRGQAWDKNVGWRIDYQVATPRLADAARSVSIYKDERFSDHAPLTIEYDWTLDG